MLDALIVPRTRDLGDGFMVRRALPAIERRSVGPFVFFDQMGPVALPPGKGMDVRPHPHIGLATVTYLFEGEILHRDSLGTVQPIRPGDVNWMTAGRGIAHSERTPPELRARGSRISGVQLWVGLPSADEEMAPGFVHVPGAELPVMQEDKMRLRVILGDWEGESSPVETRSPMFYADAQLDAGSSITVPADYSERAAYVIDGVIEHDGKSFTAGQLLLFRAFGDADVTARARARVLFLGGEPLGGERRLWWNFVSSSRKRLAQAA
ncbi:MAG: pirin family protein, partial [Betaproteobacteria bacterium]|nr:pirin family protein [Betaproteobacteria bacterium]MBV9360188.1 pirin family protein [Betaproteobacteria bacterium]